MRILITGAHGQLGSEVVRRAPPGETSVVGLSEEDLDITQSQAVERILDDHAPRLVVNTAAYTAVDRAEDEPEAAFAVNREGSANLAGSCARRQIVLLHLSTDYVFDGKTSAPISEDDQAEPLGVYGRSKLEGEVLVRRLHPQHVILRTSWLFGARGPNFVKTILQLARERDEVRVVADQTGCPTCAADVADVILELAAILGQHGALPWGTYHYCGTPAATWHTFAQEIITLGRRHLNGPFKVRSLRAISTAEYPTAAPRPAYSVLSCEKLRGAFGIAPRPWREGLNDVLKEMST
jgi:dTDP-4-dehydrorhamnose reductase